MEKRSESPLDIQIKRASPTGEGHYEFVLDVQESVRFGNRVWRHDQTTICPEAPWETRTRRDPEDGLPQFGLTPVKLTVRCKGLYQARLGPLHRLAWPQSNSDVYSTKGRLVELYRERQRSAEVFGEVQRDPSRAAYEIMKELMA